MIYPFQCDACNVYVETVRPSSDSSLPEACPKCGVQMRRIYTSTLFAIDKREYFNYGLGCHVRNRSDELEAIKRLRDGKVNGRDVVRMDEKGKKYVEKTDVKPIDVVEVGNEKPKIEKKAFNYELPRGII